MVWQGGAVEVAVAAAVEAVAGGAAAAGGDGVGAGEGGEGGLVAAASGVRPGDEGLGGGDRADAVFSEQAGGEVGDDLAQLCDVGFQFPLAVADGDREAAGLRLAHGGLTGRGAGAVAADDLLEPGSVDPPA